VNFENISEDVVLKNTALKNLSTVRHVVLVITYHVRIISSDTNAEHLEELLYQKMSLAQSLKLAEVIIIIWPRSFVQVEIAFIFKVCLTLNS